MLILEDLHASGYDLIVETGDGLYFYSSCYSWCGETSVTDVKTAEVKGVPYFSLNALLS
jgi:hypothetical protein